MNHLLKTCCMALLSCHALASPLYEANIKIPSKSDSAWEQGLQKIACQVLIKVSGKTNVCQIIPIQAELKDIEEKVSQFNYQHQEDGLWLSIAFDPGFIDQTLKRYHQPIWKGDRPKTLLWLLLEDNKKNMHSFDAIIKHEADTRGIEVRTPSDDFDDNHGLKSLTSNDLIINIQKRSEKYQTKNLIIGIENSGHIQWHLVTEDNHIEWTAPNDDINTSIANMVEHTADYYAEENADYDTSHGHESLFIEIADVQSYGDYVKAIEQLQLIRDIDHINVMAFSDQHVLVHVTIKNSVGEFVSHIEIINHFSLNTGSNYFDKSNMSYQWVSNLKQQ